MEDGLLSISALTHALAGAAGAEVATLVFYPLDLLLTRLQNSDNGKTAKELTELVKSEGIQGMYRGLIPNMEAVMASNMTYFYSYHATRQVVKVQLGLRDLPTNPVGNLLIGAFAAVVNVLLTTPLWVANTRLKLQRRMGRDEEYQGLLYTVMRIAREEGLGTLWGSLIPSLILICNPSIHFTVYESIKSRLLRNKFGPSNTLTAFQAFLLGAFAKICATIISYPLQVAQSRLRAERKSSERSVGTLSLLKRLYKEEGFPAWYKGIGVKLAQSTLTSALMFLVYERIRAAVVKILRGRLSSKIA
ncbi:hypothetical protein NDN08_003831 [Rhodosorus marinus]|uniref:ADP,ATP carrier protein n=1 Tax=Rhodosorus marinus TaxID=101924 RepID=A0AAV8UGK5_9RHOD|nr:hypothetical protein NDN08_003831 [Rhodosorus marinus]